MKQRIELQKERDFSENISGIFELIRKNFKEIFGILLFIGGPLAILISAVAAYASLQNLNNLQVGGNPFSNLYNSSITVVISYMGTWIIYNFMGLVVFSYLKVYKNHSGSEKITTDQVWREAKKHFLKIFVSIFVCGILILISFVFIFFPALVMATFLSQVNPIMIMEDKPFGEAFSKSFKFISKHFWPSLGLIVIIGIITYMIVFALSIPAAILGAVWGFNSITSVQETGEMSGLSDTFSILIFVTTFITGIANYIIYSIPSISIGLNYFNIKENLESTGLIDQINQMGTTARDEEETY